VILVSGGTGRVGSRLLEGGEQVRVSCRDGARARSRFAGRVGIVEGDLRDPRFATLAVSGADRVFLLTAQSPTQLEQEQNVIDASRAAGVRQVVKLSVLLADEDSPLEIARVHRRTELELERSPLAVTILRPGFFMQNVLAMLAGDELRSAIEDGRSGWSTPGTSRPWPPQR
jgi:uncharacterized protein YbjT (DUF2867 family)